MIGRAKKMQSVSTSWMICIGLVSLLMSYGCVSKDDGLPEEQYLNPLDDDILALFAEREAVSEAVHFRVFSKSRNPLIRTFVPRRLKATSEVDEYDLDDEYFRVIGADDPDAEFIEVIMRVSKSEYGISEQNPLLEVVPALAVVVGDGTCWWEWRKEGGTHVKEKVCY